MSCWTKSASVGEHAPPALPEHATQPVCPAVVHGTGGGGAVSGTEASGASGSGSHVIVSVVVAGGHVTSAGTGPSVTVSVTVTGPGVDGHVNVADAAPGASIDPDDAVQAYVSADGSGPRADAASCTVAPTIVSAGVANAEPSVAQFPVTVVSTTAPESPVARHARPTVTAVVTPAPTLNGALRPEHVMLPSIDVAVSAST